MKRAVSYLRILLVLVMSLVVITPNGVGLAQGEGHPLSPLAAGDELWGNQSVLGVNDVVLAVVANATDVYVGGDLTSAGGKPASNIARFSLVTHQWYALGSGVNSRVYALALSGNTLYVGGIFTRAGGLAAQGIAQFNTVTQQWSTVGGSVLTPTNATTVSALAVDNTGHLYMGGHFTGVGSVSALNIAMWNGSTWSAMGNGLGNTNQQVYSLWASSSTDVYAGDFTVFYVPYVSAGVAHWNGSAWSGLGGGTYNSTYKSVNAVTVSGSLVYIGGDFTRVTDNTDHAVNHFAIWNSGTTGWSTLGSGMDASIYTLALDASGHVYAGGQFNTADGNNMGKISVWNGSFWHNMSTTGAPGMDNDVAALYMQGNYLYAGGSIIYAGGYMANRIARWDITNAGWLGSSVNSAITSVAWSGNTLYAGGYFISAGGEHAEGVSRWSPLANDWSPLADSLSGCTFNSCFTPYVLSVLAVGNDIYAGGSFTYAGGQYSVGIARYNLVDQKWHMLGSSGVFCSSANCSAAVYTMVYDGSCIDVGGSFDQAGGVPVGNLAVYCPSTNTWGPLTWRDISGTYNINTNDLVTSMAIDSYGDLYIGGAFSSPTGNLFYIDGYGVYGVADALNGVVNAILPVGNDLYIGGNFTNLQGTSGFNYLAKLPSGASHYVQVGGSLNGTVYALDWWKNKLVVAGNFTLEGGLLGLDYIGMWNGSAWSALGSGTDQPVITLTYDQYFIYTGGAFDTAGGKTANYFDTRGQYQVLLPMIFK
jgi:trimeric autotransporter adhesin